LITWENEAHLVLKESGADKYEIVTPSFSVLAEPSVTVVDKVASDHGTEDVAKGYLEYLYSKEGQDIAARHHYRPRDPAVAAKHAVEFPKLELVPISDPVFGGWVAAHTKHFADGGVFDQIFTSR
jgi:sulfate transport system substrate-binding protein